MYDIEYMMFVLLQQSGVFVDPSPFNRYRQPLAPLLKIR